MTPLKMFITSFITGLSGAMMPGPLLAVTITETIRRGFWAAFYISCGHSFLELITVALLALGVGSLLNDQLITGLIGVVGAVVMAWMSAGMLKEAKVKKLEFICVMILAFGIGSILHGSSILGFISIGLGLISWLLIQFMIIGKHEPNLESSKSLSETSTSKSSKWKLHPFNLGIVVSFSNPYWTLWWLTIGSNLILSSVRYSSANVLTLYVGHILSDYAWYCAVGVLISLGKRAFSAKLYRGLLEACSAFMIALSFHFFLSALLKLGLNS